MLLVANDGLSQLNVELSERDKFLNIIHRRLSKNINGASWKKETFRHLRKNLSKHDACAEMLNRYFVNQMGGQPISEWDRCWK